ncbi:MAG TPA: hypothetical protein PKY31_03320 [Spirochaetota bacterium]|nr:hypothetical protein [Spirochaetota bacterium]
MNGLRGSGKLLAKIVPRGTNNRDMDYRKEIALLIKRRRQYYPVMKRLHSIHRESPVRKQPREIHAGEGMLTALVLLDIGYLDPEAFVVKKAFGDIRNFYYMGGYPFTEKGDAYMAQEGRRRRLLRLGGMLASAAALIAAGYIILKTMGSGGN